MKSSQLKTGKVKNAEAHTAPTKYGMGDYYGTGQTAKIGKMRGMPDNFVIPVPKAKLKVPPKKLA